MSSPARRVALAIDALRHGWPVAFDGAFTLLPAETGIGDGVEARHLLISSARAATLKLANQREAAEPESPVLIRGAERFDLPLARAVADPALDLTWPMKGPFVAEPIAHREAALAAMELARLAGVLPAFLVDPAPAGEAQSVSTGDLAEWKVADNLKIAARAHLPNMLRW
jgi:GTP cyclohydrolase II